MLFCNQFNFNHKAISQNKKLAKKLIRILLITIIICMSLSRMFS